MNNEIKHEILMMYDLAGDKDLIYYEAIQRIIDYIADLEQENEHLDKVNCHLRKKINNDIYKSRIEIIEEEKKIPEKLDNEYFERAGSTYKDRLCKDKINEIIDYLKSKGE